MRYKPLWREGGRYDATEKEVKLTNFLFLAKVIRLPAWSMDITKPEQENSTAQQKNTDLQDELEREFCFVCSKAVIQNQIDQLRPTLVRQPISF